MKTWKKVLLALTLMVGCYYAVIGSLYLLGFRWYHCPSLSMEPTILKDSYAVGRLSRDYRDHVRRFDIVVARSSFPSQPIIAQRVVGLPGERVVVSGHEVRIDGQIIELPSGVQKDGLGLKHCDVQVPSDSFFLLGDNTANAADSRFVGAYGKDQILGRILFKI